MQIGHAREHGRTASPQAVFAERLRGCRNDFRVVRQAEIIIGAKVDDRFRFAFVLNRGARVGRAQRAAGS